jgi:hypothetical protein
MSYVNERDTVISYCTIIYSKERNFVYALAESRRNDRRNDPNARLGTPLDFVFFDFNISFIARTNVVAVELPNETKVKRIAERATIRSVARLQEERSKYTMRNESICEVIR